MSIIPVVAVYPKLAAVLIGSQIVAGSPTSITFSLIPQQYTHLRIIGSFGLSGGSNLQLVFNGDNVSGHYGFGFMYQFNGSVAAYQGNSESMLVTGGPGGAVSLDIVNYTQPGVSVTGTFSFINIGSETLNGTCGGLWSGSPVTSITLSDVGGVATFVNGSIFSLYGLS